MSDNSAAQSLLVALPRIPSADKIVRSKFLNVLGCQVGRVVAAETLVRLRRRRVNDHILPEAEALLRDGVVVVPGFLDDANFEAIVNEGLRAEAHFFTKEPVPDKFGIGRQKINAAKYPEHFPVATEALLGSKRLLSIVRLSEGWSNKDDFKNRGTRLTYEKLVQLTDPTHGPGGRDPEVSSGDLHTDTFHYVTKVFLTLNDLTLENSPFVYAPGSHRLSFRRLAWEYRNSIRPEQYDSVEYHNRVWEDEREWLGIKPQQIQAKKNSLIITNTFGLHLRGAMTKEGAVRRMLRLDFRSNPF
jgi:Phytanoyl-CoA dioxygenase (PhyH)